MEVTEVQKSFSGGLDTYCQHWPTVPSSGPGPSEHWSENSGWVSLGQAFIIWIGAAEVRVKHQSRLRFGMSSNLKAVKSSRMMRFLQVSLIHQFQKLEPCSLTLEVLHGLPSQFISCRMGWPSCCAVCRGQMKQVLPNFSVASLCWVLWGAEINHSRKGLRENWFVVCSPVTAS